MAVPNVKGLNDSISNPEAVQTVSTYIMCINISAFFNRNPGFPTIEEELLKAFLSAEVISQQWFDNPQEMFFQRASRTDKGVSAMRMIISLKMCKFSFLSIYLQSFQKSIVAVLNVHH